MEKTNVIITIQSRQCFDTLEEDWVEQTAGGCLERTAEGVDPYLSGGGDLRPGGHPHHLGTGRGEDHPDPSGGVPVPNGV